MNDLNSILLEGRLTKDAVLKELASGLKVCEMTIAYNRKYKGSDEKWNEEVSFSISHHLESLLNMQLILERKEQKSGLLAGFISLDGRDLTARKTARSVFRLNTLNSGILGKKGLQMNADRHLQ